MLLKKWYDALDNNDTKEIKHMIKTGFDVTIDNSYAFRYAAYCGRLKLMRLLLKNGADINVNRSYALRTSVYHNHIDCVKFLVENKINLYEKCLKIAIQQGHEEIIKILLDNNIETNIVDNDLFFNCIVNEFYDISKYLLNKNISLSFNSDKDYNMIQYLIDDMQYEIIDMLLKTEIDPHELFPYLIGGGSEMVNLLYDYGFDCKKVNKNNVYNYLDETGWIIIFYLMKSKDYNIMKILLEIGIEPHRLFPYTERGGGGKKIIKILCEYGLEFEQINFEELNGDDFYNDIGDYCHYELDDAIDYFRKVICEIKS